MFKKLLLLVSILSLSFSSVSQAIVPLLIAGASGIGAGICAYKTFKKVEKIERVLDNAKDYENYIKNLGIGDRVETVRIGDDNKKYITEEKYYLVDRVKWFIGFLGCSAVTLAMIFNGNKILKSLKLKR